MGTATMEDVRQWEKKTVVGADGKKIGRIEDVYFDEETGQPEWALVDMGMFGSKHSFVPITEARIEGGDTVRVQWDANHVKDAPRIDANQELSQEEEQTLAKHYNMTYSHDQSGSGLPQGGGGGQGQAYQTQQRQQQRGGGDSAMTRSEEEIRVGKSRQPSELIRLRKQVVTENVQKTVPVSHEEIRVEREPITDQNRDRAMAGTDLRENVHEETLYTEEPVVEKRVVPKERVTLGKEQVTEERQISEEARKERIDVESQDTGEQAHSRDSRDSREREGRFRR